MIDLNALLSSNLFWGLLSLIVAILIFMAGLRVKRPKLIANGSGSGGAPGKLELLSKVVSVELIMRLPCRSQ